MATAVKVLDRHRLEARARVLDVAALLVLAAVTFSMMVILYKLGYDAGEAWRNGGQAVLDRDRLFFLAIGEGALGAVALCWIAFRLLSASGRRAGGSA